MYAKTIAITGAFAALAAAVPLAKRDIVWVTQTEEAVVTVPVTTTVWVDPTGIPSHYGHQNPHQKHTTTVQSTVIALPSVPAPSTPAVSAPAAPSSYEAPAPSSTEPAPVSSAETTTSSSVYVAPTPSSVYVAPTTSTSVYVAPTTSSVYVAPTTYEAPSSTSAAPPAYSSSSSSSDSVSGMGAPGTSYEGDLTYFGVGVGACGDMSYESDHMVAISEKIFDSYLSAAGGDPNHVAICNKYITITGVDGNPYIAQIKDRCPGCDEGSLDLPEAFFNKVTYNPNTQRIGDGRVHNMKWSFN